MYSCIMCIKFIRCVIDGGDWLMIIGRCEVGRNSVDLFLFILFIVIVFV